MVKMAPSFEYLEEVGRPVCTYYSWLSLAIEEEPCPLSQSRHGEARRIIFCRKASDSNSGYLSHANSAFGHEFNHSGSDDLDRIRIWSASDSKYNQEPDPIMIPEHLNTWTPGSTDGVRSKKISHTYLFGTRFGHDSLLILPTSKGHELDKTKCSNTVEFKKVYSTVWSPTFGTRRLSFRFWRDNIIQDPPSNDDKDFLSHLSSSSKTTVCNPWPRIIRRTQWKHLSQIQFTSAAPRWHQDINLRW